MPRPSEHSRQAAPPRSGPPGGVWARTGANGRADTPHVRGRLRDEHPAPANFFTPPSASGHTKQHSALPAPSLASFSSDWHGGFPAAASRGALPTCPPALRFQALVCPEEYHCHGPARQSGFCLRPLIAPRVRASSACLLVHGSASKSPSQPRPAQVSRYPDLLCRPDTPKGHGRRPSQPSLLFLVWTEKHPVDSRSIGRNTLLSSSAALDPSRVVLNNESSSQPPCNYDCTFGILITTSRECPSGCMSCMAHRPGLLKDPGQSSPTGCHPISSIYT